MSTMAHERAFHATYKWWLRQIGAKNRSTIQRRFRHPSLDRSFGPYINKPAGKGERFIILNAITKDGWINGTRLVFQANRCTGDYHGSMQEENFTRWFTTQLLPNIADNTVIVMDNAPYHNMLLEDNVPTLASKKLVI